jgi:hypothetical protein
MKFPGSLEILLKPLFNALPFDQAMPALCPKSGATATLRATVERILKEPGITGKPALQAGLWLYVDELDLSHAISQNLEDATGSYWHAIMHRREGDFSNSHYWFHKTGKHPAMGLLRGYDGHTLVDAAERAYPENPLDLVARQREEWANLFVWCVAQG